MRDPAPAPGRRDAPARRALDDPPARRALDDPPASPEVALRLDELHKRLGGRDIVADLSLDVTAGELVTLLGPSGCGKTTTLRMIAGFLAPDRGAVLVSGRDVTGLPPEHRPSAMVFQSYALWPHMSVFKNVAFPLKLAKVGRGEITRRVEATLELVGLMHHRDSRPSRISGGEQQRVALARALVQEPKLLLLDEPLSNLDARLRVRVREDIRDIQQRLGITTILVTHDQEEALSISDRVAVMKDGRIEQLSPPTRLYADPDSEFVAMFVGSLNRFEGRFEGNRFVPGTSAAAGGAPSLVTGIRPEDVLISERADIGDLEADVIRVIPHGPYAEVVLQTIGPPGESAATGDRPAVPMIRAFRTGSVPATGSRVGVRLRNVMTFVDGMRVR